MINYKGHWLDFEAYDEQKRVGYFELREVDNDYSTEIIAYHISVEPGYQRQGIATRLVERAIEYHGDFMLPDPYKYVEKGARDSCDYYTEEGAALFNSLKARGIVNASFFPNQDVCDDDLE